MSLVTYESSERIATITLNRPKRMKALSEDVIFGLNAAWKRYAESADRCAIIHAAGNKIGSVGADIKSPPKEMWQGVPSVGVKMNKVAPLSSELNAAREYAQILANSAPLVVETIKKFALATMPRSPLTK